MRLTLSFRLGLALILATAAACSGAEGDDASPAAAAAAAAGLLAEPASAVEGPAAGAVAAAIRARLEPDALEARLLAEPGVIPGVYGTFGAALAAAPDDRALAGYVAAVARARTGRLAARGAPWREDELGLLLALQLVEPRRFVDDPVFRRAALVRLEASLDPETAPPALRDRLLAALQRRHGARIELEDFERLALAWGAIARTSAPRQRPYRDGLTLEPPLAPIVASIYSLPSSLIAGDDAAKLLRALRAVAPERALVVLADPEQADALAGRGRAEIEPVLVPTLGLPFSPWPRDPLTFMRDGADRDRRTAVLRPNLQRGREIDALLGRALVAGLPPALDAAWGGLGWSRSPVPFHNGQILFDTNIDTDIDADAETGPAVWTSLHGLEPAILARLGLARVPVETFGTPEGGRYLEAARVETAALGDLLGAPVRLVHPLPAADRTLAGLAAESALMARLGGGAGFDLDSILTLLPAGPGEDAPTVALLGDLDAGSTLLEATPRDALDALAAGYGLAARGDDLRAALLEAQRLPRATGLDRFLELVAEHLAGEAGMRVARLPLLLVPLALRADPDAVPAEDFVLGWNNVVLEHRGGARRAEGFASLLATGDARAHAAFATAGYDLTLLPPLIESVVRGGGYRCASQHLRSQ